MAPSLLRPQGHLSPAEALQLAQRAPEILRKNPKAISSSPLQSLFSTPETADMWTIYETLLLSCLRTGNDEAAHQCLDRLVARFGIQNERMAALQGLVKEAQATNENELEEILAQYEGLLSEDGANIPITKRKIALLRSMNRIPESITALNALLEFSPTDAEAWAEVADMYLIQGLYLQAIYALEEVLVLQPNAWNAHARLGEVLLMASTSSPDASQKQLAESIKRFCRSIELCEDYLRGYYGLKMATDKALSETSRPKKQQEMDSLTLPNQSTLQKLNVAATQKLGEIVRRYSAKERHWQGYSDAEITAAKELLAQSADEVVR